MSDFKKDDTKLAYDSDKMRVDRKHNKIYFGSIDPSTTSFSNLTHNLYKAHKEMLDNQEPEQEDYRANGESICNPLINALPDEKKINDKKID
jgi:hypothetical protein